MTPRSLFLLATLLLPAMPAHAAAAPVIPERIAKAARQLVDAGTYPAMVVVMVDDGRTQIAGVAVHSSTVRLAGLTRDSRKIAVLAGEFTVTAAPKMLAFRFDDLTAKPPVAAPAQEKVTATLKRFEKDETVWEAEVEVSYPPGGPVFESFESWTGENQMRLNSPDA